MGLFIRILINTVLTEKSIKFLLKIKTESTLWSSNPTTRYIAYLIEIKPVY